MWAYVCMWAYAYVCGPICVQPGSSAMYAMHMCILGDNVLVKDSEVNRLVVGDDGYGDGGVVSAEGLRGMLRLEQKVAKCTQRAVRKEQQAGPFFGSLPSDRPRRRDEWSDRHAVGAGHVGVGVMSCWGHVGVMLG